MDDTPPPDRCGPATAPAELARRAASFGAAARAYAEHRPDYPITAIEWALQVVPARQAGSLRILDLGAGTGKLTAQLIGLSRGGQPAEVVAVEPDPQMLAELRRRLPGTDARLGSAEQIPLPDARVDAVLVGQAAHWFDPDQALPEIARVLRSGGVLAGFWNGDDDRVDWVAGFAALRTRTSGPVANIATRGHHDDITAWLSQPRPVPFGVPEQAEFRHSHRRTADSVIQTLRTHSLYLIADEGERETEFARLRAYLAATPQTASGEFDWPLRTFCARAVRTAA